MKACELTHNRLSVVMRGVHCCDCRAARGMVRHARSMHLQQRAANETRRFSVAVRRASTHDTDVQDHRAARCGPEAAGLVRQIAERNGGACVTRVVRPAPWRCRGTAANRRAAPHVRARGPAMHDPVKEWHHTYARASCCKKNACSATLYASTIACRVHCSARKRMLTERPCFVGRASFQSAFFPFSLAVVRGSCLTHNLPQRSRTSKHRRSV